MQFVSLLANIILETIKRQQFPELELDSEELACGVLQGPINFLEQLPRKLMLLYLSVYIYYILYFLFISFVEREG